MKWKRFGWAGVAALVIAVASSPHGVEAQERAGITPVPCPNQTWEYSDPTFPALSGAKAFYGRYDGGIYRVEIPDTWNGELVLFAHGLIAESGPQGSLLRAPFPGLIREHLIQNGFAWATSSYRCNGRVPGFGLLDTKALIDLVPKFSEGRTPSRVYLTGQSMGGYVTVLGLRHFPSAFAAGLAMCPTGTETTDFFAAVAGAAELITGVQAKENTLQQDLARMSEILGAPPDYTEKGRQLASIQINISGGPRPFALEGLTVRFLPNIADGVGDRLGLRAATNADLKYTIDEGLGLTADVINRRVRRKPADPNLRKTDGPYAEIVPFDGSLERPLLTIHGTGDVYVPIIVEQGLKRAVEIAGKQRLLVQRIMRIPGHCQFSVQEQVKAFDDLVTWVREDVRPEGDDVFGDLTNAGLKFTNPSRLGDPGNIRVMAAPKQ